MDEEPCIHTCFAFIPLQEIIFTPALFVALGCLLVLLIATALIAASEVSFFSITNTERGDLRKTESTFALRMESLLQKPQHLLATLLVGINFINIAIVLTLNYILSSIFHTLTLSHTVIYVIELLIEVFILVLFGEIMPKIYAKSNKWSVAELMAAPMLLLRKLFTPINAVLVLSTKYIEAQMSAPGGQQVSQEIGRAHV